MIIDNIIVKIIDQLEYHLIILQIFEKMMAEHRISVIIPTYNDVEWIDEAIESALNQTFPPFEIIVVNDGSTDAKAVAKLKALEKGIVKVFHKENGRMASARNYGVLHALGDIIVHLDADDKYAPTFFETALKEIDKPEIGAVSCYIKMFGIENKISKPRGGDINNFLFSNQCPACAMIRKDVWLSLGGMDEDMHLGYEDWELYLRLTSKGYKVHIIKKVLFYYRQTQKSTLKNKTLPNQQAIINYILNKHKDLYINKIAALMNEKALIYKNARVSWQNIFLLIKKRISNNGK